MKTWKCRAYGHENLDKYDRCLTCKNKRPQPEPDLVEAATYAAAVLDATGLQGQPEISEALDVLWAAINKAKGRDK